jgi:hypothetical protein
LGTRMSYIKENKKKGTGQNPVPFLKCITPSKAVRRKKLKA